MPPCLLLALALLGTASARLHVPPASLEVAEPLEDSVRCPLANETRRLSIPHPLGATTLKFVMVTERRTFDKAERFCARCYGGRLASIHSYTTNACLQRLARHSTKFGQVWIGAITQPQGHTVWCHWADSSVWDYSHWIPGFPLNSRRSCAALCTNDGFWRSVHCSMKLPFICEH